MVAVAALDAGAEAEPAQLDREIPAAVEAQTMLLRAAAIVAADAAKRRHPPRQDAVRFFGFQQDGPVVAVKVPLPAPGCAAAARLGNVEHEQAAGPQGIVHPTEEPRQRIRLVRRIEKIVEDLADGGDG